jgi:putative transposase
MDAAATLVPVVGVRGACQALGVARATFYRHRRRAAPPGRPPRGPETPGGAAGPAARRRPAPRALSAGERQAVLDTLHSPRFCDSSPAETYATLLDEGVYLASERTMYRLLAAHGEAGERRAQRVHPAYAKPELLATAPNQVWSWDITKLLGPAKWTYFYLYVLLDIYSRYVTGWLLADREQAALAEGLIAEAAAQQGIAPGQLTLHADRGSSMTSKPVALLLADLGITKTHARPHVSNDNPFSEAHFKTLKYRPDFPPRFESLEAARAFCRGFFPWYNHQHRHSALGLLPPAVVHTGQAEAAYTARQTVLAGAYARHPERFVRRPPAPPPLPTAAWINPPPHRSAPPPSTPTSSSPPSPVALAAVGSVSNALHFVSQTS